MLEQHSQPNENKNKGVDDIFSEPENKTEIQSAPIGKENIDISESSVGQEINPEPVNTGLIKTAKIQAHNVEKKPKPDLNFGKFLFYFLLALIILIGAFAVWALVF